MEIEIIELVLKESAKLTTPSDSKEQNQIGSRSVALRRVFYLNLTVIIPKVWVINGQYVIDVPVSICEVEMRF